jgi:hypothetical protein
MFIADRKTLRIIATSILFGGGLSACGTPDAVESDAGPPPAADSQPGPNTSDSTHDPTADSTMAPPDSTPDSPIAPTSPKTVMIYIASGENNDCQRYNAAGCKIDALHWDLEKATLNSVKQVVDMPGSFSPSISPDGSHIAFDNSAGGNKLTVTTRSLLNAAEADVVVAFGGDKSNWRSDSELLFGLTSLENSKEDRWADLGHASLGGNPFSLQGEVDRYLGAINPLSKLDSSNCSGEDPFTKPGNNNIVALHTAPYWAEIERHGTHTCPWMVEVPNTDHKNPQPVVVDLRAKEWIEGQTFWRFKMTWNADFPGCAHLAFSPDGSRVLCTDQPTFHHEDHTTTQGLTYAIGFNRIYGFELETNAFGIDEYVSVRGTDALFKHTHPAALKDIAQIWDPALRCDVYYTKRADFCGSKNRIVANTYCIDQSDKSNLKTAFSRVMLIDFSAPEIPVYNDLTSKLEDQRGVPRGSITSFTAACRVP